MSETGGDILTEATEGICWHKNNWTKSREDGLDGCGVPEFLKVRQERDMINQVCHVTMT